MTAKEFFELVERMRDMQKRHNKDRSSLSFNAARKLEEQVDEEITRVNSILPRKKREQKLF